MFKKDFKAQTEKHLGVFSRALDGLKQVRLDISTELMEMGERKKALVLKIQEHEKQNQELVNHSNELGLTIQKIAGLLPGSKGV